jgi:hypothetical protein
VHGVRAVKAWRRSLPFRSLAAAFAIQAAMASAMLALAGPAQAGPAAQSGPAAQAAAGHVSVTIDSMNPQYAEPGSTVTVTGTVSNGTGQTQAGLEVQLYTSSAPFTTRDGMDAFLSQGSDSGLEAPGTPFLIPASLKPGGTADWTASFQVSSAGISQFGVYPVAAQLQDNISGDVLTADQTLLPFWPGQRAAGLLSPLNIGWVWPLIDQPHRQVCAALANNDLAARLSPGARLSALLKAGLSHPDADLTWIIDPALLSDAAAMTTGYSADSGSSCKDGKYQPASKAAASWLSSLKTAVGGQQAVITPYANVDMSALVHQGLNADLAGAYAAGDAVANRLLGGVFTPEIAWPAGGTADLSVLTDLATQEHVGTVVLNSSQMRPADTAVFEPDDAVTSTRTEAGTTMNVLLADDTLTSVLAAGDTSSGVLPQSTTFAVRQRFLAETAMIAAEAPDSARSVVVAPPEDWSPSQGLADDLLTETVSTPWLRPDTLTGLTTAQDTERKVARQPLPDSLESPNQLSRGYLSQVSSVGARLSAYESMLDTPSPLSTQSLNEALYATESSAWRGDGISQGQALTASLSKFIDSQERQVAIIASAQVQMGGSSGAVPVSIQNSLTQPIQVRVNVKVFNAPNRTSQLTIGRFNDLVVVKPGVAALVRLPVSSAPQGSTEIQLSLTTAGGKPLPVKVVKLTVVTTRYGRAILVVIVAAIGVFVLTSVFRTVRRRPGDDSDVVHEEAGLPGSVETGTSARHPTEAPDDLADARRWADDA